ncbi:MAG: aspartate ammonia-lyase, partial [Rhizobiales bacterium]|nr:aspartate ammonia-lyase [Hyphomicrobiales bacterium]
VKQAAAVANCRLGLLEEAKAKAIVAAAREVADGLHDDAFPLDVMQGGAGTSTNMNMNEVLANRGLELMGHPRGSYRALHPNDDVNLSQSTNDTYPTAVRVALIMTVPTLAGALARLAEAFAAKASTFDGIQKLGRTQLKDAVPMTLGKQFRAFAVTLREDLTRLTEAADLLREINLGGTAIGTGVAAHPGFGALAREELVRLTGERLEPASDLIEASWDAGAYVHMSGALKRIAVKLSKIANDLRLLASGPRGGIGEIRLPPVQPGSSLMPGKVNPVIPEMVNQVAFTVIGGDMTVTMAAEAGQLQLNPFEPVIAATLLRAMRLLSNAADKLAVRCVAGIEADAAACARHLDAGTANATALVPIIGYERAAALAKEALTSQRPLADIVRENGGLPGTDFAALFGDRPPGRRE